MASTPRKRPKLESPNPKTHTLNSSRSSSNSRSILVEPPANFFPSKNELLSLLAVVTVAASVAVACNFVVNFLSRQPKPFCNTDVDFDDSISDYCEPCPRNGVCHEGKFECARGYKKHGKLCVEDADINETAKKLSKFVETSTCKAYAQFLCDGAGTVWVQEDELWNNLDEFKTTDSYGLDNPIYMHAKKRAMESVGKLLETRMNEHGIKELKCPDFLVERYKPASCYIREWIAKNALVLVPVCALLLGCTLLLLRVRRRHHLAVRAEQLYHMVCEILEENALISKNVNGEGEPWVVASWLRDHLLSPKERKDPLLWKKVEELIQEDSRFDRYPKMVKGEARVVWEWQGSLNSSGKREKNGMSKLASSGGMNKKRLRTPVSL